MGANIAGIYGAQIFRMDDRPRYRRGFTINIAVLAFGLLLATLRFIDDRFRRRRAARQEQFSSGSEHNSQNEDEIKALPPSELQAQPVLIGSDLKPVISNTVR